jgi:Ca2+/Na+ antiporter
MDPQVWGWIGGILGSVIGIAGGVFGTYCSLKAATGPAQRAVMLGWAIACWAIVILFLIGLFYIPQPYNFLMWIPYPLALMWLIRTGNAECQKAQQLDRPS